MCAVNIEDDEEFDRILYEAEIDLLDGSLETTRTNVDPGTTAESAVIPPINEGQVPVALAVTEGSYGAVCVGWSSHQELNTVNMSMVKRNYSNAITSIPIWESLNSPVLKHNE